MRCSGVELPRNILIFVIAYASFSSEEGGQTRPGVNVPESISDAVTASTAGSDQITPEVPQSFLDGRFNGPATPSYLAHQHGPLHGSDAEISHTLGVGLLDQLSLRLFSQEKGSEFVLDDFEDETEVLAN
jgi:hypothetical protein